MLEKDLSRHVVVHLVGHHDLYFEFQTPSGSVLALHESHASYSAGKAALAKLDASKRLHFEGDRVLLESPSPLGWKVSKVRSHISWNDKKATRPMIAEAPLTALRMPALAAIVTRMRSEPVAERRLALLLVTAGPIEQRQSRGASTELIGAALKRCLEASELGDGIDVKHLHFTTPTPHHFDGLAVFLRELCNTLATYRREVVTARGLEWAKHFRLALSVNTGPTPLITGIVQGTSEFSPRLLSIPDARRWPAADTVFEATDLDADDVRQQPASNAKEFRNAPAVAFAIESMQRWREHYVAARPVRASSLIERKEAPESAFWFRKGAQEVLAVIVVRAPETGELRAFHGVNLEVSLPTGTLCAERNAIGTAFAAHPTLKRANIAAVAVLSLGANARLGPCGACAEWLRKIAEANPDLRVVTFEESSCSRVFVDPIR
jgi:cytidine deaminase